MAGTVTFTLKERVDAAPAASLPDAGVTVNQAGVVEGEYTGAPAVQLRVPPPVLVTVIVCAGGLVPTFGVNARAVVLNCMAAGGAVMVILIATTDGLPVTTPLVSGSVALMVTVDEAIVPAGNPVALTLIVIVALAPAARLPLAGGVMVT